MLFDWSILNFIELIKLSLENDEISSSLSIEVYNILLEFFKSINDLKEVSVWEEESVVSSFNLGDDILNWEEHSILIKVSLQSSMLEFL